ncbi:MAG: selenide, water dikinase SelD [Anaerolineales bacterium]|nr:selenide, water dikinase SelD [Anaerolineales bacterium]MCC7189784.1 selenide, water dikinase SelD [Anaerolineales bacterium]
MKDIFDAASYPDLLVGLREPDDAAVWRLDEDRALVVTTDFFTPVVDDAYDYGAIAAANSMSDVYAMGGKPFLALNVAALPDNLPNEISSEIMRGGAEKAREAGVVIAGGHTVKDKEPKFGLVVIGFVDPRKMLSKGGLKVGDALVLTKPLGFGVTTTALKRGQVDANDLLEAVNWMKRLNKEASQLAVEFGLRGGTDITGYSLLGHGLEMANASGVSLKMEFAKIPLISCARKYAEKGCFAGGAFDNKSHFESQVKFAESIDEENQMLLFDPQTSGGLLLGVPQENLESFIARAEELRQPVWVIGRVEAGAGIRVE